MGQNLPEAKQTVLGLYVTSAEAYEKWQAAPDKVKLLDVRTPEEFLFVGHRKWRNVFRWDSRVISGMSKRAISTWTSTPNS